MQEMTTYSVGIYTRLSRDDERTGESVSIENQKEMLARYVREQGWTLYSYYCDDGVSGTTFDRSGFNKLMEDALDGYNGQVHSSQRSISRTHGAEQNGKRGISSASWTKRT